MNNTVVVELVDVTKAYPGGGGVRAFDGVSVAFGAGTFTAVMGARCGAARDRA